MRDMIQTLRGSLARTADNFSGGAEDSIVYSKHYSLLNWHACRPRTNLHHTSNVR